MNAIFIIICLSSHSPVRTVMTCKKFSIHLFMSRSGDPCYVVDNSKVFLGLWIWTFVLRFNANYFGSSESNIMWATFQITSRYLYIFCDPTLCNLMFVVWPCLSKILNIKSSVLAHWWFCLDIFFDSSVVGSFLLT